MHMEGTATHTALLCATITLSGIMFLIDVTVRHRWCITMGLPTDSGMATHQTFTHPIMDTNSPRLDITDTGITTNNLLLCIRCGDVAF
ncbi:MAG: hypothetical protein JNM41_03650 [Flavipsychrobacter sp.]|nr:hypothetical protein [Flavipsychrobacter sp.]